MTGDDLTSDEPYEPDDPDIPKIVGAHSNKTSRERMEEGPAWTQPVVHKGGTLLTPDAEFERKIGEIEAKLDSGLRLSEAEAEYLQYRALMRVLKNGKRPLHVLRAVGLLQTAQVKKLIEVKPRDQRPEDHGLALPG